MKKLLAIILTVLMTLSAGALAEGAIRVSLGWSSQEADLTHFARAFETLAQSLYIRRRANAA